MASYASFDVFDTVLTRRVGSPTALITQLARDLEKSGAIPTGVATFSAARSYHEQRLNRMLGRHADLREIYEQLATIFAVDAHTGRQWAAAEEDLERRLSVALPGAGAMVDRARARGDRIIFVSDTPHSEHFVAELLNAQGISRSGELVFTSSTRKVSKSAGGLFDHVAGHVGRTHTYLHTGDNEASDLAAPLMEGWDSRLVAGGQLTKYEALMESQAEASGGFSSWLAGSSRIARLEAQDRGVAEPLAGVASGALSALLVCYALWVAGQARLRGVRRLYFVARDGRVMLEAARPILERLAPDIELRYLYGSRHPWTLGASSLSEDVRRRWTRTKAGHTCRTALSRLGLTPEEVHTVRPFSFTSPARCDAILTSAERDLLVSALNEDPLLPMVRRAAHEHAELSMAYFRQEGLCDGVRSALVDAGWGGRTAQAFDLLLEAAGGDAVIHLVMGITGDAEDGRNRAGVELVPWLFDEQSHPASLAGLRSPNVLIEMLCADITGRTMGYRKEGQAVVPVLDERNGPVIEWGLPVLQDIAVRVAHLVAPHVPDETPGFDTGRMVRQQLRAFWVTPSRAEVRAWGDFPWEEEVAVAFAPIAQRISARSVLSRLSRGESRLRSRNAWRAGSAMISGQPWRGLLQWRAWSEANRPRTQRKVRRARLALAKRTPGRKHHHGR